MSKKIIFLIAGVAVLLFACAACTQYERDGFNPKPFNSPAGWEMQPYHNSATEWGCLYGKKTAKRLETAVSLFSCFQRMVVSSKCQCVVHLDVGKV